MIFLCRCLRWVPLVLVFWYLTDSTYKSYHKSKDEIYYIYKESNHSPSITKQLPISIETRLSKLSSNEKVFNESVPIYQEALDKSGHNNQLTFQKTDTNNIQRKQLPEIKEVPRICEFSRVLGISVFLWWLAYLAGMHIKSQFPRVLVIHVIFVIRRVFVFEYYFKLKLSKRY